MTHYQVLTVRMIVVMMRNIALDQILINMFALVVTWFLYSFKVIAARCCMDLNDDTEVDSKRGTCEFCWRIECARYGDL